MVHTWYHQRRRIMVHTWYHQRRRQNYIIFSDTAIILFKFYYPNGEKRNKHFASWRRWEYLQGITHALMAHTGPAKKNPRRQRGRRGWFAVPPCKVFHLRRLNNAGVFFCEFVVGIMIFHCTCLFCRREPASVAASTRPEPWRVPYIQSHGLCLGDGCPPDYLQEDRRPYREKSDAGRLMIEENLMQEGLW